MTAVEYLKQSFYINKEIDENIMQLEEIDSDICRCTQVFTDMPPGTHNENNVEIKLAAYLDKRVELTQKINEETDKLFDIKNEIRLRIYRIKNPKYRLILMKRYIRFKKWEQIQEELGYKELKSVYNVHKKAMGEFIKLYGNNF
nr:MAG TPA: Protein of unknown function (DUF1492) [Caudoviricetes sp.]